MSLEDWLTLSNAATNSFFGISRKGRGEMLKEEIKPFIDGDGLVAPQLSNGAWRSSDNGPMFTAEYYIMLNRVDRLSNGDGIDFHDLIGRCVGADGNLHRAPHDESPDEIDDHIAVLALYAEFNDKPQWTLPFRLFRFPQLVYAYLLAKGVPSLLMLPLAKWSALVILYAGLRNLPQSDADARRLTWHLIQATKRKSLLCRLAAKVWYSKLYKDYPNGMRGVAENYYRDNHPFIRYWVD